jgi:protease-4
MRPFNYLADVLYDLFILIRNLLVSLLGPRPLYVLLELSGPYPEHRLRGPWGVRQPQSIEDLRRQLELIAQNEAAGVIITAHRLEAGVAAIERIRGALAAFRARGKRVIAYLPQASTRVYYLASVADTIVMPEAGILDLVGLQIEATFFKEALDRLGIAGEFEQIAEYKGAAEPFTRRTMSAPMRESLNAVLDSVFEDITTQVAAARRLTPATVQALVDRAPLNAREALEAGLVDAVLFEDELPGYLHAKPHRTPTILPWVLARRRLKRPLRWSTPGRAIAVISVRGVIQMGESRNAPPLPIPFLPGASTGHATVARAFRAVERNPLFGAVILAIDSPGGSALASELIWREVDRVNRTKPVVAYLGNVAGSGGYYVAAGARRVIAQSATLTGSIGVISGKFTVRGLAARAGVVRETLTRGEAAAISSPFVPYSAEDRRRVRKQMDEVYARFVDRVAAGRRMTRADVMAVARGRIWTGRQAKERGLVDRLGDFPAAVAAVKELMGVPESRAVPVVLIRPPRGVPVRGAGMLAELGEAGANLAALLEEQVLALTPWELSLR